MCVYYYMIFIKNLTNKKNQYNDYMKVKKIPSKKCVYINILEKVIKNFI